MQKNKKGGIFSKKIAFNIVEKSALNFTFILRKKSINF
jgi:hypothetical protein